MTISGACRCESITYKLTVDMLPPSYACHCLQCQTWSGSAFGLHALLAQEAIAISGRLVSYQYVGPGEHTSTQELCGVCHTRIFNRNSAVPGLIVLRAGTLGSSDQISPVAHIWVKRKQPWLTLPSGVPSWPESPTPEEFRLALQNGQVASSS